MKLRPYSPEEFAQLRRIAELARELVGLLRAEDVSDVYSTERARRQEQLMRLIEKE